MSHNWIETYPQTHISPAEYEYVSGTSRARVTDGEDEYEINARMGSDGGEPIVECIDEIACNDIWYEAHALADGRVALRDEGRVVRVLDVRVVGMLWDAAVKEALEA